MGAPKALLRDAAGELFIVRIARALADAGLDDVTVVTGRHHDAIAAAIAASATATHLRIVRNEAPQRGQLSSLLAGLAAVDRDGTEAVVVTLVDVPMVRAATIRQVIDAWRDSRAPIVRPAFGTRRGHPVVFDRTVFEELRQAPLDEGARTVVHAHEGEIVNVAVDDPGCVVDIDTPEEYRALVQSDS